MPSLNYNNFYGVWPRYHRGDLPPGYAEAAENCDLRHGTIKPWRETKTIANVGAGRRSFFNYLCCWFGWDACVSATRWTAEAPRLYISGRENYLEFAPLALLEETEPCDFSPCPDPQDCMLTHFRVGFPEPPTPNVLFSQLGREEYVELSGGRSQTTEWRAYVVTYVNEFGEESRPSYPSNWVECNSDVWPEVIVRVPFNPALLEPQWGAVRRVNIYRLQTGQYTGREEVLDNRSDWFWCGSLGVQETIFFDEVPTASLGEMLATRGVENPPEGMRGVQLVSGTKTLVGFYGGNKLRFCMNNQPWNWPTSQEIELDENIVDIQESAGMVYVLTNSYPYVIQGATDFNEHSLRNVLKHEYPFPAITGGSGRGSVVTPWGVIYVSTDGLVALSNNSMPKVITDLWFSADDWRKLRPETMRLAYYQGSIFCVSDTYAFVLFMDATTYAKWDTYVLSTLSDRPVNMLTTVSGELVFLEANGDIRRWNAGNTYRPYYWKGRMEYTSDYQHFTACRVRCDGSTEMTLYADERPVYSRTNPGAKAFRLPMYGHHLLHAAEFKGTGQVWYAQFATNRRDLNVT